MSMKNKSNLQKSFIEFLHTAHLKTYAGTDLERKKTKCLKSKLLGHKEYYYSEKDWKYFDNYAGHIFPPGKEIVYYQNNPFWIMSYQGQYIDNKQTNTQETYKFLKEALRNTNPKKPFRGPKQYKKNSWKYVCKIKGNWEYFIGKEKVYYKKKLIFFQDIMGSIVK
ncbi:DUF5680 domain-containing protein [bacterium]|nr:DUF5680 domain-containing protein [bacterium]